MAVNLVVPVDYLKACKRENLPQCSYAVNHLCRPEPELEGDFTGYWPSKLSTISTYCKEKEN